jgi:hypothetical protein
VFNAAVRGRDPRTIAPVRSYWSDGKRLIEIVEVDHSGAIGVDLLTDVLVEISPLDLIQKWTRRHPDQSCSAALWRAEHPA